MLKLMIRNCQAPKFYYVVNTKRNSYRCLTGEKVSTDTYKFKRGRVFTKKEFLIISLQDFTKEALNNLTNLDYLELVESEHVKAIS